MTQQKYYLGQFEFLNLSKKRDNFCLSENQEMLLEPPLRKDLVSSKG